MYHSLVGFMLLVADTPEGNTLAEKLLIWVVGGLCVTVAALAAYFVKVVSGHKAEMKQTIMDYSKRLEDKERKYGELLGKKDADMLAYLKESNDKFLSWSGDSKVLMEQVRDVIRQHTAALRGGGAMPPPTGV